MSPIGTGKQLRSFPVPFDEGIAAMTSISRSGLHCRQIVDANRRDVADEIEIKIWVERSVGRAS